MQKTTLILLTILLVTLIGCQKQEITCSNPMTTINGRCCLDADNNRICDIDEQKPVEKNVTPAIPENTTTTPNITEAKEEKAEIAPMSTKEEADKVAKTFTDRWQLKQYSLMYPLFTPDIKNKKTADEFSAIMQFDPLYKTINKVELKGVTMSDNTTAQFTIIVYTNMQTITIPGTTLKYLDGAWKVNALSDVFDLDTYDAACSGYSNSRDYNIHVCAYDLAKKLNTDKYCEKSECYYIKCLQYLYKPVGLKQETTMCDLCPPLDTTAIQCKLNIAIKYDTLDVCNSIPEDQYSDKYCICYGGFAKYKKNSGFCNFIKNPDYKDLCVKSFNGEYCYLH